ncbi:aminotransferase class I/II-fold pyridoxal phosphate-dependent enzyme [Thalassobacillus hwangdonensis]
MDQNQTPLYDALHTFKERKLDSFHVPGHKHGRVFPQKAQKDFQSILQLDVTEITGMDDLHAPEGIIERSEALASAYFGSNRTHFLINGTTAGNLAMILAVCSPGDRVLVQRNSHKSIMHGLELAGAKPVFLAPKFEADTGRYSGIDAVVVERALNSYPDVKAVILTHPDYFGRAFDLTKIVKTAHSKDVPVLVDEAHGVHFHLGSPFPAPALEQGADVVVQSAHKMAPAMTMASLLHIRSDLVDQENLQHFLQVVQSSSPSYPLMASLDLARHFLATLSKEKMQSVMERIVDIRECLTVSKFWKVNPITPNDDPLKITLEAKEGKTGFQLAGALESAGIYPELATTKQVLLILGLGDVIDVKKLVQQVKHANDQLKISPMHDTINDSVTFPELQELKLSYMEMKEKQATFVEWDEAVGSVAAKAVVPYPPGIPLILKGEEITPFHIEHVKALLHQGATFQNNRIHKGISTFL